MMLLIFVSFPGFTRHDQNKEQLSPTLFVEKRPCVNFIFSNDFITKQKVKSSSCEENLLCIPKKIPKFTKCS